MIYKHYITFGNLPRECKVVSSNCCVFLKISSLCFPFSSLFVNVCSCFSNFPLESFLKSPGKFSNHTNNTLATTLECNITLSGTFPFNPNVECVNIACDNNHMHSSRHWQFWGHFKLLKRDRERGLWKFIKISTVSVSLALVYCNFYTTCNKTLRVKKLHENNAELDIRYTFNILNILNNKMTWWTNKKNTISFMQWLFMY